MLKRNYTGRSKLRLFGGRSSKYKYSFNSFEILVYSLIIKRDFGSKELTDEEELSD